MTEFLTPIALSLLVLLPVLAIARTVILRRRRSGIRFSSLSLVHLAAPGSSRIRRHLPFALFLDRPGQSHLRRGPTGQHRQRPRRPDDGDPRDRCLAQHVRDRHPAEPPARRGGGCRLVHRSPGTEHPDRHRGVRRLRRDPAIADHRPRSPAGHRRQPGDRPADGGRQRDPRVTERHPRSRPERRRKPHRW